MPQQLAIRLTVNGQPVSGTVSPRTLLADFLREGVGLTGVRVGCEQGICGACTVLVDGQTARACLMLAVQADGAAILTVEGLAPPWDAASHPAGLLGAPWTAVRLLHAGHADRRL